MMAKRWITDVKKSTDEKKKSNAEHEDMPTTNAKKSQRSKSQSVLQEVENHHSGQGLNR